MKKYIINLYKKSIENKYSKGLYVLVCNINNIKIKIFKDIISIKSQLHQPPQFNSCSAHQDPRSIERFIKNNTLIKKNFLIYIILL